MKYKGTIKEINEIIVSDPSYDNEVFCRYEKDNIKGCNWNVDILINDVVDKYQDIEIKGKDMFIILQSPTENCQLNDDGSFTYNACNKIKSYDIGMDTACVAIGINQHAKELVELQKEKYWQPDCAFKTLTDGIFGTVKEGLKGNCIDFIYISGYLDEDTGYSNENIIDILKSQLDIEELQEIKEKNMEDELEI